MFGKGRKLSEGAELFLELFDGAEIGGKWLTYI